MAKLASSATSLRVENQPSEAGVADARQVLIKDEQVITGTMLLQSGRATAETVSVDYLLTAQEITR